MTENNAGKIGGLLLAAGGSNRMGRPKQLLKFENKTLIRRAAETLVNSACDLVVVVLGAEIESSKAEIAELAADICINERWQTGMASTIKSGLRELLKIEPDLAAVVIALCDQPYVTSDDIDQLITEFRNTDSTIVAAEYGGTAGVPALFARASFAELLELKGDKGARHLIRKSAKPVRTVPMEQAALDIDSSDDFDQLSRRNNY
jgi:molybdenum cofactor cytidylyltransferase